MKHIFNCFYVQMFIENEDPLVIPHSTDEETGENYYLFLKRTQANKLIKDEKKKNPNAKYRVVREKKIQFTTEWE